MPKEHGPFLKLFITTDHSWFDVHLKSFDHVDFGGFPPPGRCDDPRRTGGLATRLGNMEGAWTIRQTSLGRFSGVSLCLMAHLWYQGVYTKTGLPRKPRDLEGRELATSGGCCTLLLGAWWAMLYRGVLPITPMEKVGGGCISRSQG